MGLPWHPAMGSQWGQEGEVGLGLSAVREARHSSWGLWLLTLPGHSHGCQVTA